MKKFHVKMYKFNVRQNKIREYENMRFFAFNNDISPKDSEILRKN